MERAKLLVRYLDEGISDEIENFICDSVDFPWYMDIRSSTTVAADLRTTHSVSDSDECLQAYHVFIFKRKSISTFTDRLSSLLEFSKMDDVFRVKANCLFNTSSDKYHTPHLDGYPPPPYVGIYYVNDSDGDTVLFDKKWKVTERISPEKGKLILFDGNIFHASTSPQETNVRLVININAGKLL